MADHKTTPESKLNELHTVVAQVLIDALQAKETLTIDGEDIVMSDVSPAMVGQAVKFLKDNNITTTMEVGDDINDLQEMLNNKPQRGRTQLRAVKAKEAAAE